MAGALGAGAWDGAAAGGSCPRVRLGGWVGNGKDRRRGWADTGRARGPLVELSALRADRGRFEDVCHMPYESMHDPWVHYAYLAGKYLTCTSLYVSRIWASKRRGHITLCIHFFMLCMDT